MTDTYKSHDIKDITLKVRKLYLDGESYTSIQQELDIPANTWDSWVHKDYKEFRTNLQKFKHERLVRKAELNVDVLLGSEDERVQSDMTKFTLKALDKDNYSDRTELTGKGGGDLTINFDPSFKKE